MQGSATPGSAARHFLDCPGEMAILIAAFDWAATPLGPIADWPQSLKSITGFLVRSPIPIVLLWGLPGTMIYNDAYSVFCGARHPTQLGKPVREGWPEVADFNDNVMRVGLAGGTLAYKDQELTLYRNGRAEPVWMNLDYSPVLDDDGAPAGVIAVVVETTERVLANRRVVAEREQFAQLFQQAPTLMVMLRGPEHRIELANPGYRALIGDHAILGKTLAEVRPDETAHGTIAMLDRVYATGEAAWAKAVTFTVPTEPGGTATQRVVDFVFQPIKDSTGTVVGIFIEGVDVSERVQAHAALRDSEARLRTLNATLERQVIERTQARGRTWELSPDLLGALNAEGYFETSNPAWQTVLGWSEGEVASMSIFEMLHPDDVARTRVAFAVAQHGRPAARFPNRFRCKDGSYRWLSWVGVPEDGLVYCSGRDITAEKAAEAELEKAQEALRQAHKMEAIGQLTGGIAHDFNNLLAGISGSLELLERRLAQGRQADVERYITAAQGAARRAASLTQRLLAFSRRQTLDPKATDVNRLMAGVEDLIRRTVGPGIQLEVVGAAGLWLTRIDPSQLENALLNLTINARDAMPDGGRITIETANKTFDERSAKERGLVAGSYVALSVSDTGTGMTPDVMSKAFDPFFTTKPLGQGTGLGLSMIHGFVRQSGGQVRIYSEVGIGTTMSLYLPRYLGEAEEADPGAEPQGATDGQGEIVLVIDDEPTVRMLIVEVLAESGYTTIEAEDGAKGLAILQSDRRIDLLITDVGLPGGMNGRQVADAARATRPALKVLFVTGYAENAAVGNGLLDSGMEVITKPFAVGALGNKVRAMIEGHA